MMFLVSSTLISQNVDLNYQSCIGCPQGMNVNTPLNNALFQYGNPVPYELRDIESDFDLRDATGDSRWHKGLDLRNHGQGADQQRGDAIISPEDGIISEIDAVGYKYIIIDGVDIDLEFG